MKGFEFTDENEFFPNSYISEAVFGEIRKKLELRDKLELESSNSDCNPYKSNTSRLPPWSCLYQFSREACNILLNLNELHPSRQWLTISRNLLSKMLNIFELPNSPHIRRLPANSGTIELPLIGDLRTNKGNTCLWILEASPSANSEWINTDLLDTKPIPLDISICFDKTRCVDFCNSLTWQEILVNFVFPSDIAPDWILITSPFKWNLINKNNITKGELLLFNWQKIFTGFDIEHIKTISIILHKDHFIIDGKNQPEIDSNDNYSTIPNGLRCINNIKNPFLENGFLTPFASINRLRLNNLRSLCLADDVKGKLAIDLLSNNTLIHEIKKCNGFLKFDLANDAIMQLDDLLKKKTIEYINKMKVEYNPSDREHDKLFDDFLKNNLPLEDNLLIAQSIAEKMGRHLAWIILALKEGLEENKKERPDWTDEHWNFWKSINKVYIAGGMTVGTLGLHIKNYCNKFLNDAGISRDMIEVVFCPLHLPILGLVRQSLNHCTSGIIFDFGHTKIKRAFFEEKSNTILLSTMQNLNASHVSFDFGSIDEEKKDAIKLHGHIIKTILDVIALVKDKNLVFGNNFYCAIANYICKGKIANRAGYGKLRLLSDNYEAYLSNEISKVLKEDISVHFIHDGTASGMALEVKDGENPAVLTLGTGIGVGFPPSIREKNNLVKKIIPVHNFFSS